MGKVSELAMLVDELKKCGETLVDISEGLAGLFSGSDEEKSAKMTTAKKKAEESKEKVVTLEQVRAVLAEKSRVGFTADVKAIITRHGAVKMSDIAPTEFEAVLAEAEVLGNG